MGHYEIIKHQKDEQRILRLRRKAWEMGQECRHQEPDMIDVPPKFKQFAEDFRRGFDGGKW